MGIRTLKEAICDKCKEPIKEGELYRDYSYYGITLHEPDCVSKTNIQDFMRMMGDAHRHPIRKFSKRNDD